MRLGDLIPADAMEGVCEIERESESEDCERPGLNVEGESSTQRRACTFLCLSASLRLCLSPPGGACAKAVGIGVATLARFLFQPPLES